MVAPPLDPDDWSDEQWQEHIRTEAEAEAAAGRNPDGTEVGAPFYRRLRASASGSVTAAAMMGLEQALYGEKPSQDVVIEAQSDDPDRDLSRFDPDDPTAATISLRAVPPSAVDGPGVADPG